MKVRSILLVVAIYLLATVISCTKNNQPLTLKVPHLPAATYIYVDTVPSHTGNPYGGNNLFLVDNTPQNNLTTNAGATLGRVLFYDKVLSINNSVACGSCHKQQYAFADNGNSFSKGYDGGPTARNSIGIWNERFNSNFFFDGRVRTLEGQTLLPVENHVEMGMENIDVLPQKISSLPYYPQLFKNAFGTTQITKEEIAYALAQFLRSITSFNSKADAGSRTNFANFSSIELDGVNFFSQFRCNTCHLGLDINDGGSDFANIGLDTVSTDIGLMDVTGLQSDKGRFRVPSLRNVALTAPYMHDGRYQTLEDVLDHYSNNIAPAQNLDIRLTNMGWGRSNATTPVQMNMTAYQKQAIIAFLNTLTDNSFTTDPRFSDPFQ